jgi:glycosyltransferase involved in cell wall biosynthesis
MLRHAQLLIDAGYAVRIIAGAGARFDERIEAQIIPELGSRHAEVLRVKKQLDAGHVTPEFDRLRAQIEARLRQALSDVDVLITHNVFTLHKNLALTTALHQIVCRDSMPLKHIAWHHDFAWSNPLYRDQLHDGAPWELLRRPWPYVQHVTVSHARQKELAKLYAIDATQIKVVPPGVDPALFFGWQPLTQTLVDRLKLLEADIILLLPARVTRRKNIELAVRTLAALRTHTALDARLIVTGPPGAHNPANAAYLQSLLALRSELGIDRAAHFLYEMGARQDKALSISDAVMGDLFTLADALFFPSQQEGFGIPVLEAGLARLPAFCADIPPLRETGAELATFFDPNGEPGAIASQIAARLASDQAGLLRRRVRQNYTWTRIFDDHIRPLLEST